MRAYMAVGASVAALVLMGASSAAVADPAAQTMSVTGAGSVFVTPDVADLSVSVSRAGSSSRRALSAVNRATRAVVHAIRVLGIPAADIQTQGVSVSSTLKPIGLHGRRHRKWTASESLSIRVTKIKLLGRVIDRATNAGASGIDGPTFSFGDPSAGKTRATRAAIADARRRADDAAAAIGYRVTGVQSVQLDPGGRCPPVPGTSIP